MKNDPWLDKWLDLIRQRSAGARERVLELGCGSGWDIQFLEENIIHRYEKPKSVWEVLAKTNGSTSTDILVEYSDH
jgi:hypothetical protein